MIRRVTLPAWFFRRRTGLVVAAAALVLLTVATAPTLGQRYVLDAALLYLVITLLTAAAWGYTVGVVAALAAGLLVNFFFLPPVHAFAIESASNIVALILFVAVALIGAAMLSLVRRQYLLAEARRRESDLLLNVSREMAQALTPAAGLERLCAEIARRLPAASCSVMALRNGWRLEASAGEVSLARDDEAIATETWRSGSVIRSRPGRSGRTLTFLPLAGTEPGVLRMEDATHGNTEGISARLQAALVAEASVALQRVRLSETAGRVDTLAQSDEMKSALLASISHDLRSPLTSIKASVGSLRDASVGWTSEDIASFLEEIEGQTDRLTRTVSDLLALNRLQAGVVHVEMEPVEVGSLLEEVVAACRDDLAGRAVAIAPDGAGLWIRTDYRLASQALTNLVQNAGRHSVPGGGIRLAAARVGPNVAITVTDDGPGIPAGELPFVFERFQRGPRSSGGTGLGLAIVRAMVQLCGGTVAVHSRADACIFTVTVPASERPTA